MSASKRHEMIVGGTGGQGVISIGYAIAAAASLHHKYVTRFPIYMATMRGGPAFCTVIFSDEEIPAPILSHAENIVAMESGSYGRLKKEIKPEGRLFVNSSVMKKIDEPDGYTLIDVPATDIAKDMGAPKMTNMVMLGAYREVTGILSDELMEKGMAKTLAGDSAERMEAIMEAYNKGAAHVKGAG